MLAVAGLRERWAAKDAELVKFESGSGGLGREEEGNRSRGRSRSPSPSRTGAAGGLHDASAFPWGAWVLSGAPVYAAFSFYVVPCLILTTT